MNRPAPVKPDNFFLLLFQALRQKRIPLALRIVSHSLLLVALALVTRRGGDGIRRCKVVSHD